MLVKWIQRLYLPLLIGGGFALIVYKVQSRKTLVDYLLWLLVTVFVSFAAERWASYQPDWLRSPGDRRGALMHAVVNEGLHFAFLSPLLVLAGLRPWPQLSPTSLPMAVQMILAIVISGLASNLGDADFGLFTNTFDALAGTTNSVVVVGGNENGAASMLLDHIANSAWTDTKLAAIYGERCPAPVG